MKEIKIDINNLLNIVQFKHPLLDRLKNFVDTFDGTNTEELLFLVYTSVATIMRLNELEVTKKGYDQLETIYERFEEQMSTLRKEYDCIKDGKTPPKPFNIGKNSGKAKKLN